MPGGGANQAGIAGPHRGITQRNSNREKPWGFVKADHTSYYKKLPTGTDQAVKAVTALKLPIGEKRYRLIPHSLMLGPTASVIRYNVFSMTLVELVNQFFVRSR